jgi:glycosyltransferase involved in cell wall biosynthesis
MGGIQRALINMLDFMCMDTHYDIDLFVFGEGPLIEDVPPNVNIINGKRSLRLVATPFSIVINSYKFIDILLRMILILKVRLMGSAKFYHLLFAKEKQLGKYDIAISYFNDVPYNYFNQGTNQFVDEFVDAKKKIAWIHNDPLDANFDKDDCRNKYKNFDLIVCVSDSCSKNFKKFLPEYSEKVITVYNFFPLEKIKSMAVEKIDHQLSDNISLVTVSRIDNKQKRLNIIPEVVNKLLKSDITNFLWTVVGDGPDLGYLKNRVDELNINKYLQFIGNRINPYPYIKESSLFVLVSKYEGYPMVIGEALILGTPVITTNFAAASEQIISGRNGIIVDFDENDIYSKICEILKNGKKIQEMKKYILENPYTNNTAKQQLINIIDSNDLKDK